MIASFLLSLREGLEAALIIGMLLGTLRKMEHAQGRSMVWLGTVAAVVVSLIAGVALHLLGASFEGRAEEIFEGIAMLLAAGMLTWVIFWMRSHAKAIGEKLEADVKQAIIKENKSMLFGLAFLAVVREGIELAIFLTAATFTAEAGQVLLGFALGMVAVALISWALFKSLVRLDLQKFFQVTSILLVLFAAGLVAHGVHELNEVGWIPSIVEHVWDMNHILDEKAFVGGIMKALFGYNGNPSLTEVISYGLYFVAIAFSFRWLNTKNGPVLAVSN